MSNQTNFQIFSFYIIDFWEWALVNIMQLLALWQSHKMQSHSKTTKWTEVAGFVSESSYCQHPYLSVFFLLIILYMGIMLYNAFFGGRGQGLPLLGEPLVLWKRLCLASWDEGCFSALPPASEGISRKPSDSLHLSWFVCEAVLYSIDA